jgi:hypothetical protein
VTVINQRASSDDAHERRRLEEHVTAMESCNTIGSYRADRHNGNALNSYSGDVWFDSRPGHWIS